jgi:hypothetical protein
MVGFVDVAGYLTGSIATVLFSGIIYLAIRVSRLSERVARLEGRMDNGGRQRQTKDTGPL